MNLSHLARWRVPLAFLLAIPVATLAGPTPRSIAWGGSLAILGELLRIWAAGHLEKSREVTASGPYRLFRHPLYVGSTLMGIGLAVASARIAVGVLVGVYLLALVGAAVQTEEKFLRSRFGAQYRRVSRGRRHRAALQCPARDREPRVPRRRRPGTGVCLAAVAGGLGQHSTCAVESDLQRHRTIGRTFARFEGVRTVLRLVDRSDEPCEGRPRLFRSVSRSLQTRLRVRARLHRFERGAAGGRRRCFGAFGARFGSDAAEVSTR